MRYTEGKTRTPFIETEALLFVMDGDLDEAERIVSGMDAYERTVFARYVGRLNDLLLNRCAHCDGHIATLSDMVTVRPFSSRRATVHKACVEPYRAATEEVRPA